MAPAPGVETWISELEPCGTGRRRSILCSQGADRSYDLADLSPRNCRPWQTPSAGSQGRSLPFSVRRGRGRLQMSKWTEDEVSKPISNPIYCLRWRAGPSRSSARILDQGGNRAHRTGPGSRWRREVPTGINRALETRSTIISPGPRLAHELPVQRGHAAKECDEQRKFHSNRSEH